MKELVGGLGALLTLGLLVGMLKPGAILPASWKPSRLKVLGVWFGLMVLLGALLPEDSSTKTDHSSVAQQAAPQQADQAVEAKVNEAEPERSTEPPATEAESRNPAKRKISSENYVGCTDRDRYEELVEYAVAKDMDAWKRAFAMAAATGGCLLFSAGEEVYVTDTALFSGLVQVRRQGETTRYWTAIEAVGR